MTAFRNPVLIISALLASLGPFIGNALYEGPAGTADEILKEIQDPIPHISYLTLPIEVLGLISMGVVFAWFAVYLYRATPVAAASTAVLGGAALALKFVSFVGVGSLLMNPSLADRNSAALFEGIGESAFVLYTVLFCAAFTAAGLGLRRSELGGWRSWWPIVTGALGTGAGIVAVTDFDLFLPIPFLVLLLWLVVLPISLVNTTGTENELVDVASA